MVKVRMEVANIAGSGEELDKDRGISNSKWLTGRPGWKICVNYKWTICGIDVEKRFLLKYYVNYIGYINYFRYNLCY